MTNQQPDPTNMPHMFIELPDGSVATPDQVIDQDRSNFEAQLPLAVLQEGDVVGFQFVHQGKPGGITFDVTGSTWTGLGINDGKPSKTILGKLEGDLVPEIAKGKTSLCMGSFVGGTSIMDGVLSTGHEPAFRVSGDVIPQDVRLPSINGYTVARQRDGHLEMLEPQDLELDHSEIGKTHTARINDMAVLMQQFEMLMDPRDNTTNYGLGVHDLQKGNYRINYYPGRAQGNRLTIFDYTTGRQVEYYYDPSSDIMKVAYTQIDGTVDEQTPDYQKSMMVSKSTAVTYVTSARFGLNVAHVNIGEKDMETSLRVPVKTANGISANLDISVQPGGTLYMPFEYPYTLIESEHPGSFEKARQNVAAHFREDNGLDVHCGDKQISFPSPQDISESLLKQHGVN